MELIRDIQIFVGGYEEKRVALLDMENWYYDFPEERDDEKLAEAYADAGVAWDSLRKVLEEAGLEALTPPQPTLRLN